MGTTIAPYTLRVPADGDIADVPQDLTNIANDLTAALNNKLERGDRTLPGGTVKLGADKIYQAKIDVKTAAEFAGLSPSSYAEGDIIFVVP